MHKTGLVSISFRNKTPKEILIEMKNTGLHYIEWGSDVHAPCTNIAKLREIVELQYEYGIQCSSYGTYFWLGKTPIEELVNYIKAAKILGTKILRLWCGCKNSEEYGYEEKRHLFAQCKLAALIAEENDVILCMECHINTFTNKKESIIELMNVVNSNNFRMYWQPNQFKSFKENLDSINTLSKYIENIHVFNWKGDERFPLVEGVSEWKKYLEESNNTETLLLEFMPDNNIASLGKEVKALNEIIGSDNY